MSPSLPTPDPLRFPIGPSPKIDAYDPALILREIDRIASLPARLRQLLAGADETSLLRPYRPEGWNALQVVHHLADSHINSYTRFKLALTEESPTIKPYEEGLWVQQADATREAMPLSLALLEPLHARWVLLLSALEEKQWRRTFFHPGYQKTWTLFHAVSLYAWHGDHHLEHVKLSLKG